MVLCKHCKKQIWSTVRKWVDREDETVWHHTKTHKRTCHPNTTATPQNAYELTRPN